MPMTVPPAGLAGVSRENETAEAGTVGIRQENRSSLVETGDVPPELARLGRPPSTSAGSQRKQGPVPGTKPTPSNATGGAGAAEPSTENAASVRQALEEQLRSLPGDDRVQAPSLQVQLAQAHLDSGNPHAAIYRLLQVLSHPVIVQSPRRFSPLLDNLPPTLGIARKVFIDQGFPKTAARCGQILESGLVQQTHAVGLKKDLLEKCGSAASEYARAQSSRGDLGPLLDMAGFFMDNGQHTEAARLHDVAMPLLRRHADRDVLETVCRRRLAMTDLDFADGDELMVAQAVLSAHLVRTDRMQEAAGVVQSMLAIESEDMTAFVRRDSIDTLAYMALASGEPCLAAHFNEVARLLAAADPAATRDPQAQAEADAFLDLLKSQVTDEEMAEAGQEAEDDGAAGAFAAAEDFLDHVLGLDETS